MIAAQVDENTNFVRIGSNSLPCGRPGSQIAFN